MSFGEMIDKACFCARSSSSIRIGFQSMMESRRIILQHRSNASRIKTNDIINRNPCALQLNKMRKYIYVIGRPRGPHWEKLCQRSWVRPEGRVFPDLGRQIMCLLFSSVEYFLSVEFLLQPISNLVNACVWHLGNRKSTLRSFAFLCFLGHYLHFTFFRISGKKMLEKTWKLEN